MFSSTFLISPLELPNFVKLLQIIKVLQNDIRVILPVLLPPQPPLFTRCRQKVAMATIRALY